jgi:hypothetical protein
MSVIDQVHSPRCGSPDSPIGRRGESDNLVAGQSITAREDLDVAVVQAFQSVSCADTQVVLAIFEERRNGIIDKPGGVGPMLQYSAAGANPEKPRAKGSDPGSPVAVVKEGVDFEFSRHAVEMRPGIDGFTHAIFACRPDCSVRILAQAHSAGKYFREAILHNPFDSILRAHPDGTARILEWPRKQS